MNLEVFGNVDLKLKNLEIEINNLDSKAELVGLSEEEVSFRKIKFVESWQALSAKESLLTQKSRIQLLREENSNSVFFHAILIIWRRKNQLLPIKVDNLWVEDAIQIKLQVEWHFTKIFAEVEIERPFVRWSTIQMS